MRLSPLYLQRLEEATQQGRQQGEGTLVLLQLARRFGTLSPELRSQIQQLSIAQLEELGEALLDFSTTQDLTGWLQNRQLMPEDEF